MHDELNAIRRAYGEPGTEGPPLGTAAEAESARLAEMKTALDALPPQRPDAATLHAVLAAAAGADALGPVRTVYEEEPGTLATPAAQAEAAALSEVKAGLDALPPQRPDAATLHAVLAAAAGTAALDPVRTVYGEAAAALAAPAAQAEAAALSEVKAGLDALPPQRPAPSLVDAVVAAAGSSRATRTAPVAAAAGRAADRPARRGVRRGAAAGLSAAFALVLALSIGLWPDGTSPVQDALAPPLAERAEAPVIAEETEAAEQEAGPVSGAVADAAPAASAPPAAAEPIASAEPPRAARTGASQARQQVASAPPPTAGFSTVAERRLALAEEVAAEGGAADLASALEADEDRAGALPLADGDQELRMLYLRLQEMQAAQVGVAWDGAPVSLGAPPDSTPAARSGWMQVRVDR
ncbi:MAG: hypothetical protein AAGI91_05940 [Bacteroidota bacterium]